MIKKIDFKGWPSGDYKPIAVVITSPKVLSERLKLELIEGVDELSPYEAVHFQLEDIGPIVFLRHKTDEKKITEVLVDIETEIKNETLNIVLELTNISREKEVSWTVCDSL